MYFNLTQELNYINYKLDSLNKFGTNNDINNKHIVKSIRPFTFLSDENK